MSAEVGRNETSTKSLRRVIEAPNSNKMMHLHSTSLVRASVIFCLVLLLLGSSLVLHVKATIGSDDLWYAYWNEWETPASPENIWTTTILDNDPLGNRWIKVGLVVSVHEYQQFFTTDAVVNLRVNLYFDSFAEPGLFPVPAEMVALHIEKDSGGSDLEKQQIVVMSSPALQPGYSQGNGLHQSLFIQSSEDDRLIWGALEALGFLVGLFAEPIGIASGLIFLASSFLPQPGPTLDYVDAGSQDYEAVSWWENWGHDWGWENPIRQYCFNSIQWIQSPSSNPQSYYGIKVWAGVTLRNYDNPFGVTYIETQPVYLRIYSSKPNTPSTPSGPSSGYRWTYYTYSTSTTDPNGDRVKYQFDWGDGSSTWTGYYDSGATASASHKWSSIGAYPIRVRAKDDTGLYSSWSGYKKMNIINKPGGGCPTLFGWDGSEQAEIGILNIHSDSSITFKQGIVQTLVPENHFYKLSLRELDEFTSHIDYVKLYAVDNEVNKYELNLAQAVHNELGQVKRLLLREDGKRVDLAPQQTIDLKFTVPNINEIAYFIFEINGYNRKPP